MASVAACNNDSVMQAWESVIKHLQVLSSDDLPVLYGLTPGVVTSVGAATSVENAFQDVLALPQGDTNSCNKLLAHKVRCHSRAKLHKADPCKQCIQ